MYFEIYLQEIPAFHSIMTFCPSLSLAIKYTLASFLFLQSSWNQISKFDFELPWAFLLFQMVSQSFLFPKKVHFKDKASRLLWASQKRLNILMLLSLSISLISRPSFSMSSSRFTMIIQSVSAGICISNFSMDSFNCNSAVQFLEARYSLNLFFMQARLKSPMMGTANAKVKTILAIVYRFI